MVLLKNKHDEEKMIRPTGGCSLPRCTKAPNLVAIVYPH